METQHAIAEPCSVRAVCAPGGEARLRRQSACALPLRDRSTVVCIEMGAGRSLGGSGHDAGGVIDIDATALQAARAGSQAS
eukprot:scaffold14259_cov76-Phaeocystis_antarctica.AAC.1